ncbi:MAG: NUDIX hydrolase [Candidatus Kapaibacterium sp.]
MKRKVAAGGIVIRSINNVKQAILVQHHHKGWGFPKGHVEQGESFEQTALREVEEETGVLAVIVAKLPPTHYQFTNSKGQEIDKTVHWFLMEYQGIGHQTHAHEVADVQWVSLGEVFGILSFDNDRVLLRDAEEILSDHF